MSNIRVTYSGLISLIMACLRIITGFAFTYLIVRLLLPDELGTWKLILGLTSSIIFMNTMSSFWSTRDIARGIDSAKSAISLTGGFTMISIVIFSVSILLSADQTNATDEIIYGLIIIPFLFFYNLLFALAYGYKPHLINIGQVLYGIVIVITSLVLVYFLDFGLIGIIIASSIAYLSVICFFLYHIHNKINKNIDFKTIKKWFKNSWLALYHRLAEFIFSFDILLFALITSSVVGLAFYTIALSIGALVGTAATMAVATYSKLLSSDNYSYIQDNITKVVYIGMPMLAIVILFAKEGIFLLNPIYAEVYPAIAFFALRTFFHMFSNIFSNYLLGSEKVDIDDRSTVKNFLNSQLFYVPSVNTIRNIAYILSLVIVLSLVAANYADTELVIAWSIIMFAVEVPFTIYWYFKIKRRFSISIEWAKVSKYTLTAIGTIGFSYYLSSLFLVFDKTIFVFLPNLLLYIIFGAGLYFIITYMVDDRTRNLTKAIITELRKKRS
tara:strand:+ start:636 stop:2129 length:1494 start_codon:yes stop_codon:yes gene_type:complete